MKKSWIPIPDKSDVEWWNQEKKSITLKIVITRMKVKIKIKINMCYLKGANTTHVLTRNKHAPKVFWN
jgi:hypothetical protein